MKRSEEESIFIDDLKQLMSEDITDEELEICLETLNILEKKGIFMKLLTILLICLIHFFPIKKYQNQLPLFLSKFRQKVGQFFLFIFRTGILIHREVLSFMI